MVKPNRVRWNEPFGEADYAGALCPGFTNEPTRFLRRSLSVEKNGSGLNCRHTNRFVDITHQNTVRSSSTRDHHDSSTFIAKESPVYSNRSGPVVPCERYIVKQCHLRPVYPCLRRTFRRVSSSFFPAYPVCCQCGNPMLNFGHGFPWFSDDAPRISAG